VSSTAVLPSLKSLDVCQMSRELSEAFSSGSAPGNASASCPNFAADVPSAMTGSVRRSVQYWDASPPGYSFAA